MQGRVEEVKERGEKVDDGGKGGFREITRRKRIGKTQERGKIRQGWTQEGDEKEEEVKKIQKMTDIKENNRIGGTKTTREYYIKIDYCLSQNL